MMAIAAKAQGSANRPVAYEVLLLKRQIDTQAATALDVHESELSSGAHCNRGARASVVNISSSA